MEQALLATKITHKMNHNFLNLKPDQLDKPLFRVFKRKWFFDIVDTNQVTLAHPRKWDDPFENFIMNATGELMTGEVFTVDFRNNFFGQCWTMTRENDAMWRIYAPDEDGVRLTTTPRKLLQALYDQAGRFKDINSFIGKVEYKSKVALTKLLTDSQLIRSMLTDSTGRGQVQTLLFKRVAFRHENEVRLIYNSNGKVPGDYYKFQVNPFELFDDIVFDPRMRYDEFKKDKDRLIKLGYRKRIVKSTLYQVPQLRFKL